MTVASVQARVEAIEAKLQPEGATSAGPVASAQFAALLQDAGGQSSYLGSSAQFGNAARGQSSSTRLGAASLSSSQFGGTSAFSGTTAATAYGSIPGLNTAVRTTGQAAVAQGLKHLGTPYLWGGTDPAVGLDCSALVQHAYRDIGVDLPRVSRDQARMGVEVSGLDAAQPGDLIAFGSPVDHISIYVGDGKILQAPRSGDVVKISDISRPITTIRRIVSPQASPAGFGNVGSYPVSGSGATGTVGVAAELQYQSLFEEAGQKHGVDPALLAAIASVESGFNPSAQSPAGAQGLMQFMPATAAEMGVDPFDPASAIDGAARYIRREIDRFGSVALAAAAYNAGAGAVSRHGGIPPYAETQNYVKKVISAYEARR